jgi:isoleucyl-tRNA synthetase
VLQALTPAQIKNFEINGHERVVIEGQEMKIQLSDVEIHTQSRPGLAAYTDGEITVAIDLELTPELIDEGNARELINRIQNLRKESGFAVTDRIDIYIDTTSAPVKRAVEKKSEYIKSETLTRSILKKRVDGLIDKEISVGDESFTLGIKKTSK